MTQVLIAVDDTETSVKTARTVYALFGDKATYTVVNVADQSPMIWGGDALVWGIGYPITMAPSGVVEVDHAGASPRSDSAAAAVDSAPIDAAIAGCPRSCQRGRHSEPTGRRRGRRPRQRDHHGRPPPQGGRDRRRLPRSQLVQQVVDPVGHRRCRPRRRHPRTDRPLEHG